jgi:hypothetical protein
MSPGAQLALEANETAAQGAGQDAPAEPLALGAGAAAVATKDLASSMLVLTLESHNPKFRMEN